MEAKKRDSYQWLLPLGLGLLAFLGLCLPLVKAHPVSYDPVSWTFSEASRASFGASLLFGGSGALVWPYYLLFGLALCAIVLLLAGRLKQKLETFATVATYLFLISAVLFFLSAPFYGYINAISSAHDYASYFVDEANPSAYYDNFYWYVKEYVNIADGRLGGGAILSGSFCALASFASFSLSLSKSRFDIRSMTEVAMLCASAIALDVLFHLIPNIPGQVGSISIALVPLFIVSLRHGPAIGLLASSFIFGLITCFTDGYGLWLYPLDYLVAYSGVAIIGFFRPFILGKDQTGYNLKGILFIALGCMAAGVMRYIGSGASSIVNYGYPINLAALVNLYALISAALCAAILIALYGPLLRLHRHFPLRANLRDE